MTLSELLLEIDDRLTSAGIPHAFGGAIALAYCTKEPRATRDIDCNVFVRVAEIERVFLSLSGLVATTPADKSAAQDVGQVRIFAGDTPIDLFFNTDDFHDGLQGRILHVPFVTKVIPILSGYDLVVFKCLFNRRKDWADVYQIAVDRTVDLYEVRSTLIDLLGSNDHRVDELDKVITEARE